MDRFVELKNKYASVLQMLPAKGIRLAHLHVDQDKLYMQGAAPNQDCVNAMWDQIKVVDPTFSDLTCDVQVDSSLPQPEVPPRTYTVVSGDSLWKIAAHFYGNGAEYPKIIAANPAQLKDDKTIIHPGDVFVIPE
ncbi:MAG: LysM peptidoglycan-binding domain-containing protein [Acidobacteriota bacterium]